MFLRLYRPDFAARGFLCALGGRGRFLFFGAYLFGKCGFGQKTGIYITPKNIIQSY